MINTFRAWAFRAWAYRSIFGKPARGPFRLAYSSGHPVSVEHSDSSAGLQYSVAQSVGTEHCEGAHQSW